MNIYLNCIYLDIIDMNKIDISNNQVIKESNIKLDLYPHSDYRYRPHNCTFNLKGEFILYSEVDEIDDANVRRNRKLNFDSSANKIIWIYSTQTENNKWKCTRIYKIPEDFDLISISKYDKLYLSSNNYFYEWDILTENSRRIFASKNKK